MLVKRDLIYGKKNIINYTFSILIAFSCMWLPLFLIEGGNGDVFTDYNDSMMSASLINITFGIFTCISGVYVANSLSNKQKVIADKMLPASDFEKFLSRCLFVLPGCFAMCIAALLGSDLLRTVLSLVTGNGMPILHTSILLNPDINNDIMHINGIDRNDFALITAAIMWHWTIHSFYVLGGMFFRRHQFVLTSMVGVVSGVLFIALAVNTAPLFHEFDNMSEYGEAEKILHMFGWMAVALLTAITALNYWLAYKIYTRMQVINNKWTNV